MGRRRAQGKDDPPRLMVIFKCPKCLGEITLDAYKGPPSCANDHVRVFMNAISLDKKDTNPLVDIEAMRTTERTFS